jgi:AcrR family transcriptional regulator
MMASQGVDAVSLREIRLAAGQRNTSAMQFHFGDRHGLLRAIADRHEPRLAAALSRLYRSMLADGRDDDRSLVEVLVRPVADYVFEGPSQRAWIRIGAELASRPELSVDDFVASSSPESVEVATVLLDRLRRSMSRHVAVERIVMMMLANLHFCAARAAVHESGVTARPSASRPDFVDNVVAMAYGALFATSDHRVTAAL